MVNVEAYSGTDLVANVMTNASHEYTMQLPPGTYSIRVPANAPEGVVDTHQVTVTTNRPVEADSQILVNSAGHGKGSQEPD